MKTSKTLWFGICLILLAGCSHLTIDTPEKKYLAARSELNVLLEVYISMQERVPAATHRQVAAIFREADTLMDIWELQLDNTEYDYMKSYRTWLSMKSEVIRLLKEIYQKEEEG